MGKAREIELLNYQIKEITDAALSVGESEDIKKKLVIIGNAEKNREALGSAYSYINGSDFGDESYSETDTFSMVLEDGIWKAGKFTLPY